MTTLHKGAAARPGVDRSLAIWGWLVFAFLYLPIVVVVVFSFSGAESVGRWGGFSLRWYEQMFANEQLMGALENSVVVALISTAVATVFGTAAALSLDRYRRWVGRGAFDGLLYLPIIIPDVTMAVMLLLWFTSTGVVALGRAWAGRRLAALAHRRPRREPRGGRGGGGLTLHPGHGRVVEGGKADFGVETVAEGLGSLGLQLVDGDVIRQRAPEARSHQRSNRDDDDQDADHDLLIGPLKPPHRPPGFSDLVAHTITLQRCLPDQTSAMLLS